MPADRNPTCQVQTSSILYWSATNHHLTEATHLAQYVPFVLETEKKRIREEVSEAEFVSVLFDGNTRQGQALAVIVRFVDKEFEMQQLLVRLNVLAKV